MACYLGLVALLLARLTVLYPPPPGLRSLLLLVFLLPLMVPLRGVLHARRYTLAWSAMLMTVYFLHGAAGVVTPGPERLAALAEAILSAGYAVLVTAYLRGGRASGVGGGEDAAHEGDREPPTRPQ